MSDKVENHHLWAISVWPTSPSYMFKLHRYLVKSYDIAVFMIKWLYMSNFIMFNQVSIYKPEEAGVDQAQFCKSAAHPSCTPEYWFPGSSSSSPFLELFLILSCLGFNKDNGHTLWNELNNWIYTHNHKYLNVMSSSHAFSLVHEWGC